MHIECTVHFQPLSRTSGTRKPERPHKATVTLVQRRNPDGKYAHSLIVKCPNQKTKTVPVLQISRETVEQLFTSNVTLGKATIAFRKSMSLFIRDANPRQLSGLMESVRDIVAGRTVKPANAAVPITAMRKGANPTKPVNLRITERSRYPSLRFPTDVTELCIDPIGMQKVDKRWFKCGPTMRKLEVCGNPLAWDFPDFCRSISLIGNLKNLHTLNLSGISGKLSEIDAFPFDFWENLPKGLQLLNLSSNQLRTIPANVARLLQLQELRCDNNQITKIADDIAFMPRLKIFSCSNNKLLSIPATLQLISARSLDLSGNQFSSEVIPAEERSSQVGSLFDLAMAAVRTSKLNIDNFVPREVRRQKYNAVYCFMCNKFVAKDSASKIYKSIPASKFRSVDIAGMPGNAIVYEHRCLKCVTCG